MALVEVTAAHREAVAVGATAAEVGGLVALAA